MPTLTKQIKSLKLQLKNLEFNLFTRIREDLSLKEAASKVIQEKLKKMGGSGGVIGIDRNLNSIMEFNTKGMYRASYINDSVQIKIYEN